MNKITTGLVVGLVSLSFLAAPVLADTSAIFHGPRIKNENGTSSNWSGYAAQTNLSNPANDAVSDVQGSWVVPAVTCTKNNNTYSSAWVGIDGYSSNSVEQIGTEHDCSKGSPRYYAWYEMYPAPSILISGRPVMAGDSMTARVQYIGANQYLLTLINNTRVWTFTTTQTATAQRQSAEWIMEAPSIGSVLPLVNFGTINFTGSQATINGHVGVINDTTWQNDRIDMVSRSGIKASTSTLNGSGDGFSVTWLRSK